MSETDSPRTRPLQFSLLTVMIVTATVAIVLALSTWNPPFGAPVSLVIAGSTWTALAVRAGRRRLAYYLAGASIGPVAMGVVFLPVILMGGWLVNSSAQWLPMGLSAVFAAATTACVRLLRRLILRGSRAPESRAAIACVYLTAALSPIFFALFSPGLFPLMRSVGATLGDMIGVGIMTAIFSPVIATFYLPLAWPVAIVCVRVLRRIDPAPRLSELERRVIEAVTTLEAGGVTPIRDRHLTGAVAGDEKAVVATTLDRLVVAGILTWTPEEGYRTAGR
jgi:hypothetical protein